MASAETWFHLGVVQNCHHFQKSTQSTLGGGRGSMATVRFLNVDYDALHFHTGSVKSTFSKYSFVREGGGHKTRVLCVRF